MLFVDDWKLHLCRYGYSTVQQLERVVQSYAYFKIPLETFVTDSQYMDHDQDFTISPDFEPFGVSSCCNLSMLS